MDVEKLKRSVEGRGWSFKHFATGEEAANYLAGELEGVSVGIGGSGTVDAIGLYDKLTGKCPDVVWHWKEDDQDAARVRAMNTDVYISGANAIAETGEIVNIDGKGNRVASTLYGHKRLYIVAGKNKVQPTLEDAIYRARNVAAPLRARSFNVDTPCVKSKELKCYDCRSPQRVCCGMSILMYRMMGMEKSELILIDEDLGM
ncbi:MAG TPA: lactate utilization protein [Candidatus Scatomorpha merdigallinarum]|nr:lactate utilization protein [Candidatus Scatomorpha merdigallinarum]